MLLFSAAPVLALRMRSRTYQAYCGLLYFRGGCGGATSFWKIFGSPRGRRRQDPLGHDKE